MAITFICSSCNAFRYRSIRDPGPDERLTESDFMPVEGQTTPISPGIRPTCDTCGSALRAATERPKSASNGAGPSAPSASSRGSVVAPPAAGGAVLQLFCVEPGEDITQIKDLFGGDRLLVITTRRIVLIHTSEVPA